MNPPLQALGEKIRLLRRSLNISQEELADRSELHRTYLSDLERGTRNPSFLSLLAVGRGLGLTISALTRDIETAGATGSSPETLSYGPLPTQTGDKRSRRRSANGDRKQ